MSDRMVPYVCIKTACPYCRSDDTRVIATRPFQAMLVRRHLCNGCQRHFRSQEQFTLGGRADPRR